MSQSARIAQYVAGARTRALPGPVAEAARLCLADWLGVALGARGEPAARSVRDTMAAWNSTGGATLLLGGKAAAPVAALCNGTAAHCLDFDDTYVKGNTHVSAPVWAATLALAEELQASESLALAAFVAGFETAARAGYGLGEPVTARGWHCTGVFGRIGAAASACVLLGLKEAQVLHALGAAATQASGLTASFGTMAKPFHAGKAAMDGILAAQLAAHGFKAATGTLDAGGGLDNALVQDGSARMTPADFSQWEILQNSFKPYAACHLAHPAIEAARLVRARLGAPGAIAGIEACVSPLAHQVTGGKDGRPRAALDGKFDVRYCVALALHGHPLSAADFREPLRALPEVIATAQKVRVTADPALGYTAARLRIDAGGAPLVQEVAVAKGHPGNPMDWKDMEEKFFGLVDAGERPLFDRVRSFGGAARTGLLGA